LAFVRPLAHAFAFGFGRGGVSIAAPQVTFVMAFLVVHVLAFLLVGPAEFRYPLAVPLALALSTVGLFTGTALGWRQFARAGFHGRDAEGPANGGSWLGAAGVLLTVVGLTALATYLARIGTLPIFLPDAEQARVDAAVRGGAPARVLGLVALPGTWLLVAGAVAARSKRLFTLAVAALAIEVALWLATANRAPAFVAAEVWILTVIFVAGRARLRRRALVAVAAAVALGVFAAGVFGAIRMSDRPNQTPDARAEGTAQAGVNELVKLTTIALRGYLVVPIQNLEFTMDAVPARIPWRLGYTYLQPVLTALPGRQTTFDLDLKEALGQDFRGGGTVPGLLGESYANFGPLGWLVVPALVAWLLQWSFWFASRQRSAAAWTLHAYLLVQSIGALLSGLSVASPFPVIATVLLGIMTWLDLRTRRRAGMVMSSRA
jgi:hypothetical protein